MLLNKAIMEVIHCGNLGTAVPSYTCKWVVEKGKIKSGKALRSSTAAGV